MVEMQSPGAWPGLNRLSEKRLRVCLLVLILVFQFFEGDVRDLGAQFLARLEHRHRTGGDLDRR